MSKHRRHHSKARDNPKRPKFFITALDRHFELLKNYERLRSETSKKKLTVTIKEQVTIADSVYQEEFYKQSEK